MANLMEMLGNNPMMGMVMQMMSGGKTDPMQMISQLVSTDPKMAQAYKQAQEMSKGKTETELTETIKNTCKSAGIDYDESFVQFKQMFGAK